MTTGIEERHGQDCPVSGGGSKCAHKGCGFRASVWDRRAQKRVRKTFPTAAAAKSWRSDAQRDLRTGHLSGGATTKTLKAYADDWLKAAETGGALNRSGNAFKPSAVRSYRTSLTKHVYPTLGAKRLADVDRPALQRLVTKLQGKMAASTVRNAFIPVQTIYRYAVAHGDVPYDPTSGAQLPAANGKRVSADLAGADVATLIDALPEGDRALWATAFYAGLRLGELQALRWSDVDLAAGKLRVERAYDQAAQRFIPPKSAKGTRTVPISAPLAAYLKAHPPGQGLAFGDGDKPFVKESVRKRAERTWTAAKLTPVGFHDARHTAASIFIAADVNIKAVSEFMGHGSISITLDRYGHLLPGSHEEAAKQLDAYLMGQSLGQ